MQQVMMRLQQLQRQYQQVCQDMMALQNGLSQVMNDMQQEMARTQMPMQGMGVGQVGMGQSYVPGSVYGSPRQVNQPYPQSNTMMTGTGTGMGKTGGTLSGLTGTSQSSNESTTPTHSQSIEDAYTSILGIDMPSKKSSPALGRQSEFTSYGRTL